MLNNRNRICQANKTKKYAFWRTLYSFLWYIATPLIQCYLKRRARKAPAYLEHWNERFGRKFSAQKTGVIWIHAVSVGETRAALPLVRALRNCYPDAPLLITQMTPTGRTTALELYGQDAEICYLPYDYPKSVEKFIKAYCPLFGVLIETELWPNLIYTARRAEVPLFLVNARLSERSLKRYRWIYPLIYPTMQQLTATIAQSEEDARRLQELGAAQVVVCGNIKYDVDPPKKMLELGDSFRARVGKRHVFVCASTRSGEERLILQSWIKKRKPACLLVLIPRHPERFAEVSQLVLDHGLVLQCRTDNHVVKPTTDVWLGDSMGELFAYYQAANIVFVGGSLQPLGSHSLIEPAAVGRPIILGPSTFNFAEASQLALASGAASQVMNADELVDEVLLLIKDENRRNEMAQAALEFSAVYRGATAKTINVIKENIDKI